MILSNIHKSDLRKDEQNDSDEECNKSEEDEEAAIEKQHSNCTRIKFEKTYIAKGIFSDKSIVW